MVRHHAVTVAAPRSLERSGAPYLLQREDDDFIAASLAELSTAAGRGKLAATRAGERTPAQRLKLFQPVQRRFHVALIEAWCDTAGQPRIDPARVEAAGLVLRRVREHGGERVLEGWMRAEGVVRGWLPVDRIGGERADPLPAVRLAQLDTGASQVDRALRSLALAGLDGSLQEDVAPMFVAPPDVCRGAGHTVYYAVVPTSSSELAQTEPDTAAAFEGFEAGSDAFFEHLVQPLRGVRYDFPEPPLAGRRFDRDWLPALIEADAGSERHRFLQLLRQLAVEFDVFGDGQAAQALRSELAGIQLPYVWRPGEMASAWQPPGLDGLAGAVEWRPRRIDAASFLREAVDVLFDDRPGSVEMPLHWPELDAAARRRLHAALSASMRARFAAVKSRPGRFDEPEAEYVLRAFVRLKPEGPCPPRTVWSDYTEPFVIAPWFEGVGDPVQVPLPDLSDRNLLKSLKPNVSFLVPPALQGLLAGDPNKLAKGEGRPDRSLELGWICSFSLPVITLCAFIVLNIFLALFDLIFRWLMFVKICIPFPKLNKSGGGA